MKENSDGQVEGGESGWLADLKADLPASVVVFFVAVPLCLGIALASGAPLISGLVAGIVGGIVVGAISRSPLGVSGPAAGLAVIVLTAIEDLGGFEIFLVAVVIGGAIQVVLGLAKAGILGYFFPSSVIKGMLSGIGILIVLKQIPHAVGHDSDPEGDLAFQQPDGETTLSSLGAMFDDLTPAAIVISISCLAILILWEAVLAKRARIFQLVQGPLAAVAFAVGFQLLSQRMFPDFALTSTHLVSVPIGENFGDLFHMLARPDWSQLGNKSVWVVGATIAVVASLETLLCVDATDKLDPRKRVTPPNRELFAQGAGNMLSGLLGGLPVTQVIVRSSANIQSGGRSKMSAILHGCLLLASVALAPQILNLIPLAALAAILFVVGYKLAKPALFKQMYSLGLAQFLPFIITILGIVFTDLLTGIALGMAAALVAILRSHYINSHFMHLSESNDESGKHRVTIELAEEVTFLNKAAILKELKAIPNGTHVVIDGSHSVFLDQDVVEVIQNFEQSAGDRDITIERMGMNQPNLVVPRTSPRVVA
ncbi:MAG: SulP family inorganic anion transporter [Planctomycetota bacterium]